MLRIYLTFIFVSSLLTVHAQEKLQYYQLLNKADSFIFEKDLTQAYSLYSKAVAISATNPYTDMELVKLSLRMKDLKRTKRHLELAIKNGATLDMIEADSNVNRYFKQDDQSKLTYKVLRQQHLSKIPYLEDRMLLLNMLEKDQALRSLLGVIEYKKADSLIFASDTANMSQIMRMVERIGFPDIEKVGLDGANAMYILLLHTLNNGIRDEKNLNILCPLMKNAVQDLKYPPFYMGIVIDRHKAINKQKQIYGTYWEIGKNKIKRVTPIEKISEVDIRRKEIGLPPLLNAKTQWGYELPSDYQRF